MAIKMIAATCPKCGANIRIEEGRRFCFCTYCGAQIVLDDGSKTIRHEANINKTNRVIDEAKIREAEKEERVRLARSKTAQLLLSTIRIIVIGFFMLLGLFIVLSTIESLFKLLH